MTDETRSEARARARREQTERIRRRGPRAVLTPHEVETMIRDLSDELEADTYAYADLCDATHEAEMDYKHQFHSKVVELAGGPKRTADVKKSMAWLAAEDAERAHRVLLSAKEAATAARFTKTTRIEALRTISASIRSQT